MARAAAPPFMASEVALLTVLALQEVLPVLVPAVHPALRSPYRHPLQRHGGLRHWQGFPSWKLTTWLISGWQRPNSGT